MSIFSQYTWGDFFKVVIPIIALYYAWVAWAYYREDIREWMTNRGDPEPTPSDLEDEAPDAQALPSFMVVSDYRPQTPVAVEAEQSDEEVYTEPENGTAPVASQQIGPILTPYQPADEPEVSLGGPDLGDQPNEHIGLPILLLAENPLEQRVDEVLKTAQRIKAGSDGTVVALDESDQPAVALASAVNNQKAREAFSDMSFTR